MTQLGLIGRTVYLRELLVDSKQLKQPQSEGTNLRGVYPSVGLERVVDDGLQ